MDERAALALITDLVAGAGDDAASVGETAVATDMLHAKTDFPDGVTDYTVGWRTIAVTLSDIAAVGGTAVAALAVYSPPVFVPESITRFVEGASAAATTVGADYVGGDLDVTDELITVGIGIGRTDEPVGRDGASVGDEIVVTGTLGRGALGVRLFERGDIDRANDIFRFVPRIEAGSILATSATAMIDSSDGLARSVHLLAEASEVGVALDSEAVPFEDELRQVTRPDETVADLGIFWGEDFELVAAVPPATLERLRSEVPVPISRIGRVVESGVSIDGDPLPDRGYEHG